jgi:hypothetical protein
MTLQLEDVLKCAFCTRIRTESRNRRIPLAAAPPADASVDSDLRRNPRRAGPMSQIARSVRPKHRVLPSFSQKCGSIDSGDHPARRIDDTQRRARDGVVRQ